MSIGTDNSFIPCEEILFRAILKKRLLSADGRPDAAVFLLRPQDEGKLSTWRCKFVSGQQCKSAYNSCFGLVTLHVGTIRTTANDKGISLDVIADALPDDALPGHASVINLPDHLDPIRAEWVAGLLRDQSRLTPE